MPFTSFYCLKTKTKKNLSISSLQKVITKRGPRYFAKSSCQGVKASRIVSQSDFNAYKAAGVKVISKQTPKPKPRTKRPQL